MKARQIPTRVREALAERSQGLCERCGQERATQAHHRRPRGMGGSRDAATNVLSNLLHLSDECHAYVEANRTQAVVYGWLVKQHMTPASVPAKLWTGFSREICWLSDDGDITPLSDVEIVEAGMRLAFDVEPEAS